MSKGINSMKLNNKSNKKVQVNNVVSVTGNSGTYVEMGVATHNQYNSEVSMLNYTKDTKYQKYTINNIALFNATDESLANTSFETIGEEPIIGHCIKIQDIFNFYTSGCIQQFYECFSESHSYEDSKVLARFLSAIGIEVYKDVVCYGGIYKGRYKVSNLGRVFSLPKTKDAKILKPFDNGKGYLVVRLCYKGQQKDIKVHRLVALTFYGEPIEKMDACHANGITTDNRLFNIDFKTHAENMLNPITLKKYKDTWTTKAKAKSTESTTTSAAAAE